jgi:Protein of unknown function (DUF1549)/Protein of unknown function (DUF1553)
MSRGNRRMNEPQSHRVHRARNTEENNLESAHHLNPSIKVPFSVFLVSVFSVTLWFVLFVPGPVRAVDFDTEIVPVFTKAGCNAGSCHGAAAGRGGFHLSLLGGDAAADYDVIVHALEGRRINLAKPAESLLLAKPTGELPHEGGIRIEDGSAGEKRLLEWIQSGAGRANTPRKLTHFDLGPSLLADKVGIKLPLKAIARFDKGKPEDVTAFTVFTSSDSSSLEINAAGTQATVKRPGQHVIIARFLDRVVPLQITLPLSDKPLDLSKETRANFIDDEILKKLEQLRLPPSPRADDAAFLRRVYLDLTGSLPPKDEIESFVSDKSADKRAKLVDKLLKSDAFVDYWTWRFANLFRIRPAPNDSEGARAFHNWVHEQIKKGAPLDEMASALVTATGDSHVIGPANFARMAGDARSQAELVSTVFMGVRMQCANCHNHPLDRWTQDDYHGLAAVFARLDRGRVVKVTARGAVTNLRTGENAIPRIPGDRYLDVEGDGREAFAKWLTASDNHYFARATVNRLWKGMFGRGLIDPTDDLRDTNPATHPELLDKLAADFIKHGCDFRHTLRLIALSETYGCSGTTTEANRSDDRFYSHAYRRPLEPEVLADAIAEVTGVSDKYGDQPVGTRAIALIDPRTPAASLDILGRCSRATSCEGTTVGGGLPAKLHQLNGELINRKITAKDGRLHRLIMMNAKDEAIVAEFYLRALGRNPTEKEVDFWRKRLESVKGNERVEMLEDFVWSILNSSEFGMNR